MTDYTKLVEALRCCGNEGCHKCPYQKHIHEKFCWVIAMKDAADAIEALQAQLPKLGEWIEDTTTYAGHGLSNYKCSLCGKICGTWRSGLEPSELPNWCGNCGADMRKMEVQDA